MSYLALAQGLVRQSWHFWEGHFSKSKNQWEWHLVKGHDITWDLQLTLLQKSLYPNYMQLFGALCDVCWSQAGPSELMQSTQKHRGSVCLTLTPAVNTCLRVSEWAEHRCLSIMSTTYTSHIAALKCAFTSKWCVRAGRTVVDRLIRLSACLCFVGSQWGYIYLHMYVCLDVK